MASIFEQLNKLNVNMQGKNISIFETMFKINAVKKKIPLWQKRVASKNFFDFSLLHDFMTEHEINFQMQLLPLIEAHLKLLEENFEKLIRNRTGSRNNLLFYSCPREALGPSPLRSSNPLKINFTAVFELIKSMN